MPSSVKVPVLSKTKVEIYPAKFILGGDIQKMFFRFSLTIAKTTPQVIAAGIAGGTVTVSKSRALRIIILFGTPIFI